MELLNSGDGDGSGYGYGSGYGDGAGYGDGSGAGYGDGSGDPAYFNALIEGNLGSRAASLRSAGATLAFWRSDKAGKPSNGGESATIAAPGVVEEINGPLKICSRNALHASLSPREWSGERLWIVALYGEVQQEGNKFGALKREILMEIPNFL